MTRSAPRARWLRFTALLLVLVFAVTACGSSKDSSSGGGDNNGGSSNTGDEGKPTPGGSVTYGLEAETTGGFCLQEAQLAIAGIQVTRTIYDTLTIPDADGNYVPYLAQSIDHNATFDEWTIKLRSNVKFHDGSPLTAEVVKNNLDAYRGKYPARKPLLFVFVFQNIKDVSVADPTTVKITTNTPWPALPSYLYSSGRLGMTGQKQLDDTSNCAKNLIGTGPFKLKEWVVNDHLTAVKNPDYWQKDKDGQQLPYLDSITYKPITEGAQRVNALQSGQIQAMHTSGPLQIDQLRQLRDSKTINLTESDKFTEVGYTMLNVDPSSPFSNQAAREAFAYAIDRDKVNQIRNKGILKNASGPFAEGNMGYLKDAGFPAFDLAKAKEKVKQYTQETGKPLEFTLSSTPEPDTIATAQLVQSMAKAAGMNVKLKQSEQSQLINEAIGGQFQATLWRNHPGGDPDTQYVWWHSGSPVNFGRINDKEIDRLLDEGRTETDTAKREQIYEDLNREFSKKLYDLWGQWTLWDVATAKNVFGVYGPDNPDGSKPNPGLAVGHPVLGLWVKK
jgi:peptide/nickel transport system substrate-binding protein